MHKGIKIATLAFVGGLLFWAGYEIAQPVAIAAPPTVKPNGLLFGTMLFGGILIPLLIHELGHLLTGLWLGFRFQLFVVFLLGVKRTDVGIRIYLNKDLGYMGGVAAVTPAKIDPLNKRKFAAILLAGPLASILLAIICLLLFLATESMWRNFWLITGATSLAITLATTLPRKSGMFFTDRARFQRLMSKGRTGASEEALLNLMTEAMVANSYANIAIADAVLLQGDKEIFIRFWGYYYAWQYYLAQNNESDAQRAKEALVTLKANIPKAVWQTLQIDG